MCPFPEECSTGCDCGTCFQPVKQDEVDSLTSFYKDTNGGQWEQSTNWLQGSNPCNQSALWFGVECGYENDQQFVSSLVLDDNALSGQISLDMLSHLTTLSLNGNNFDPNPLPDLSGAPKLVSPSLFLFVFSFVFSNIIKINLKNNRISWDFLIMLLRDNSFILSTYYEYTWFGLQFIEWNCSIICL